MKQIWTICAALLLVGVWACRVNTSGSSKDEAARAAELAGTYVTAAHGNSLDKDWSYSGALVLDSTRHFGISLRVAVDSDAPQMTSLHGTYSISTRTVNRRGKVTRTTRITLEPVGRHSDRPVLIALGDTLKYSGPWWFNAGLGVLDIADPILVRVSGVIAPDSVSIAASSTPASSRGSSSATPVKKRSSGKVPSAK